MNSVTIVEIEPLVPEVVSEYFSDYNCSRTWHSPRSFSWARRTL